MKKLITLLLAMTLTLSLTACGGGKTAETVKDDTEGKTAVDILNDTWAVYEEGEKFAIAGGDYENMVMDAPGTVNVSDGESLDALLGFPAASAGLIDDGASLMHMMNQNTFTAGVYHVTKADDVQAVADAVKENIMNRQWMCGFPDDLVVYSVGTSYVAAVFGAEDLVDNFEEALETVYTSTKILHNEDLTF
jgi:hypothetical protein